MSARKSPLMAMLPLLAAFLVAPLALLAGKLTGRPEVFQPYGPQGMTLWTGLAGLALLASLVDAALNRVRVDRAGINQVHQADTRLKSGGKSRLLPVFLLGLALCAGLALLVRHFAPLLGQAQNLAPLLEELRLPALALFAGLWVWQFGPVGRTTLARLGAGLGALMTLDFLLTAIMARGIVLGGGFLLGAPHTQGGGQDALAFLLCVALCATLESPTLDHSATAPTAYPQTASADTPSSLCRWLIVAGLLASFSRPGLLAGGGLILLLDRHPLRDRLALAISFAMVIWMSLALPLPHMTTGRDELSLAWHLSATMEALGQTPNAPFLGLPLNEPLALAITEELPGLEWDPESMGLAVHIFELPSSALRLLAAWGAGGPIAVLAGVLLCALRGRSRLGFGLVVTTLVCGALTPVLHIPATATALCLALLAAANAPAPTANAAPNASASSADGTAASNGPAATGGA